MMKNKMNIFRILVAVAITVALLGALASCDILGGGDEAPCQHDDPSMIEVLPAVAPTCISTGLTEGKKCHACNTVIESQEEIPTTECTDLKILPAVAPTCDLAGLTEGKKCNICDKIIVAQKKIDPTECTDLKILPYVAPTCTESGLTEGKQCNACDTIVVEQKIIPATGCTDIKTLPYVAPTCTEVGLTEGKQCNACGRIIVAQEEIPTVECVIGDWIIGKEPSVSAEGLKYRACTLCGTHIEEETIPQLIPSVGLAYEVNDDGETCSIIDIGTCEDTDLVIPEYIDGYKVTSIIMEIWDCPWLTSVVIPGTVTSVDDYTFAYCASLTRVVIPDSVTSIGYAAFAYCTSLTSINIPDSVTSIGVSAFEGCYNLTSIIISDSVTSIGDSAFFSCISLTSVVIPESVTYIGVNTFAYCDSLTIYCAADEKPDGWDGNWNPDNRPVEWGYEGE